MVSAAATVYLSGMQKWLPLLLLTGALSAGVEDNAALFSKKAVAAANERLANVRKTTGKEILVLTVNNLGGKTIVEYTRNEGRIRQLNGIITVISKNPSKIEIMAGKKTAQVFRKEHRDALVAIFAKNLRKAPDDALNAAMQYITEIFTTAASAPMHRDTRPLANPVRRESSSFGWLKWVIIIGVIFLIIRLISYFMSSRNNANANAGVPGMPGQTSGFGGGGFFSSMIGGIFGAVAGNWIYDKMFGDNHDHSNYRQDSQNDSSDSDWRGDDKGDFDSGSGSGGDWGSNDSGGSSSDGGGSSGDSGGGDW
jgi:uncharacterized membrane protein YgcG